jgi:RecA-family ATPase
VSALTATAPTALDYALAYARRGWRVVPTRPGGKRPIPTAWQTEGTTDTARITHWWTQAPDNSISIVTGAASSIWVLDVDVADGKRGDDTLAELEAAHGPLPDTWEVVTGSGGRHLYFAWPANGATIRNSASGVLGPGLDVRGEGGQVVAPPSIHANGTRYEREASCSADVAEVPAWLIDLLTAEPTSTTRPTPTPAATSDRPGDLWAAQTTWADLLTPDGWQLHHTDASGEQHWTRPGKDRREGTSATIGYRGADVLKVFTGSVPFLEAEQTYTKLGYLAARDFAGDHSAAARSLSDAGYHAPRGPRLDDLIANKDTPPMSDMTEHDRQAHAETLERLRPTPIDWSTFWDAERDPEWLIEPIIPSQRHTVLFAPAKMGKSLLALEIAAAAATGTQWGGIRFPEPIRVVYLDFEMTIDDVRERLSDMGYSSDDDLSALAYYSLPDLPTLDSPLGGQIVLDLAIAHDAQLVVIDTMARVVVGEENSADTYRNFDRCTSLPLKRAGVAVLRLDHAGKDLEKGQRGSSEKNGYADLVWSLVVTETGQTTLRATHRRIGWAPSEIMLQRELDPVLRHVQTRDERLEPGVIETVRFLDELGIDPAMNTKDTVALLKEHGRSKRRQVVVHARRIRSREAEQASLDALRSGGKSATERENTTTEGAKAFPERAPKAGVLAERENDAERENTKPPLTSSGTRRERAERASWPPHDDRVPTPYRGGTRVGGLDSEPSTPVDNSTPAPPAWTPGVDDLFAPVLPGETIAAPHPTQEAHDG